MNKKKGEWKKKLPMSEKNVQNNFDQINCSIKNIIDIIKEIEIRMSNLEQMQEQQEKGNAYFIKTEKDIEDINQAMSEMVRRIGIVNSNINSRSGQIYDHISTTGKMAVDETKLVRNLCSSFNYNLKDIGKMLIQTSAKNMRRNLIEHLDYHLTDHCNLNCIGCSTFAPIADKHYADLDSFEKDMKKLYTLVGDAVQQIHLLGGEPLLHPHVEQFAKICRSIFTKARIDITTNGLLIFDMPDSFWRVLNDNNIAIKYTQYPIKFDYAKMVEYIKEKGVYVFSAGGKSAIKYFRRIPLNLKGTFNIYNSFIQCPYTDCVQMRDGKLYHCPASAFSDVLNCRLNLDNGVKRKFTVSNKDYLVLDDVNSSEDIFSFLSAAIPFCQYCDVDNVDEHILWKRSSCDIKEWVDL